MVSVMGIFYCTIHIVSILQGKQNTVIFYRMWCKCIILVLLMIFYVYLIVSHFLPNLVGGRLEGFDTQKNSTYSSLMDKYRPIQVKCTKSDCDFAQAAMDNNIYLDPSKNYFNDGFRNCNADICI